MVQGFGKLVDVKQHRAHHVEIPLVLATTFRVKPALHHLQQRFQHRRQAGMFVADHAQGCVVHVGSPVSLGSTEGERHCLKISAIRA
jgi:hypothetical protein